MAEPWTEETMEEARDCLSSIWNGYSRQRELFVRALDEIRRLQTGRVNLVSQTFRVGTKADAQEWEDRYFVLKTGHLLTLQKLRDALPDLKKVEEILSAELKGLDDGKA